MDILFVSSEASPFVKTGGLGDVSFSLPSAISGQGEKVRVLLPLYGSIASSRLEDAGIAFSIKLKGSLLKASILKTDIFGVEFYFVKQEELYGGREGPYGDADGDYHDNDARFIFFNRAVIEFATSLTQPPDIIHLNDWQTGLVPLYLTLEREKKGKLSAVKSVFSIHNLAYQGHFPKDSFTFTSLPARYFTENETTGVAHYGKLAFLKTGILYADFLTTVSKTYAKEILSPEFGFGLEQFLNSRKKELKGILNGIDTKEWNPRTDKLIPANYSANNLSGKKLCRAELLREFGIDNVGNRHPPLVGMVSRLVEQKGFDIMISAIKEMLALDFSLVILGSGQKEYEEAILEISKEHPKRVGLRLGYDNRLAHIIEAGADIFLMPSRFEPCGLNQMFSLKYGTVPLVRATGGLADTVTQYSAKTGKGNGFVFNKPEKADFLKSFRQVLEMFGQKEEWEKIMKNGMAEDNSWGESAGEYVKLYKSLIGS